MTKDKKENLILTLIFSFLVFFLLLSFSCGIAFIIINAPLEGSCEYYFLQWIAFGSLSSVMLLLLLYVIIAFHYDH